MERTDDREIKRGDILWINCDPSIGIEPTKTRTCVVVSNDVANRFGQAITVVPTQRYTAERVQRAYMVDLRKPGSNLQEARVANASMLMTYDRKRVVSRAGRSPKRPSAPSTRPWPCTSDSPPPDGLRPRRIRICPPRRVLVATAVACLRLP